MVNSCRCVAALPTLLTPPVHLPGAWLLMASRLLRRLQRSTPADTQRQHTGMSADRARMFTMPRPCRKRRGSSTVVEAATSMAAAVHICLRCHIEVESIVGHGRPTTSDGDPSVTVVAATSGAAAADMLSPRPNCYDAIVCSGHSTHLIASSSSRPPPPVDDIATRH